MPFRLRELLRILILWFKVQIAPEIFFQSQGELSGDHAHHLSQTMAFGDRKQSAAMQAREDVNNLLKKQRHHGLLSTIFP